MEFLSRLLRVGLLSVVIGIVAPAQDDDAAGPGGSAQSATDDIGVGSTAAAKDQGRVAATSARSSAISVLLEEMLIHIFGFLSGSCSHRLLVVASVCRTWRRLCAHVEGVELNVSFPLRFGGFDKTDEERKVDFAQWAAHLTSIFPRAVRFNMTPFYNSYFTDARLVQMAHSTSGQLAEIGMMSPEKTITDDGITELLRRCPKLKALYLNLNALNCNVWVPVLVAHCRSMETIQLWDCGKISGAAFELLAGYHNLRELDMTCSETVTDTSVSRLAKGCPLLESIKLRPVDLTDKAVISLAENCPRLTHFALFMWIPQRLPVAITDVAVEVLVRSCPKLVHVEFWSCTQLTDNSLFALANHCPEVKRVHFSDCARITDVGVEELARRCTALAKLDLPDSGVTDVGVRALAEHCKPAPHVDFYGCAVSESYRELLTPYT